MWMIIIAMATLILTVVIWCYIQIKKSLPQLEGELILDGLKQVVTITRDENGVPHIRAENEHDLFFAQGYVTAQDRLFQMDLARRKASGGLSEIFGEKLLVTDKFMLSIGLRRAAKLSEELYTDETRTLLDAFSLGVNRYISQAINKKALPLEFRLIGYEPTPWSPLDSLAIGKLLAFDLNWNWKGQAFRNYLLQNFSTEEALELFPTDTAQAQIAVKHLTDAKINLSGLENIELPNTSNGSNNWVIAGSKTESGYPVLANDPHLELTTPSVWYQTHLNSQTSNVSGVTIPGIPGVMLGHNEFIAWGVTNTGADVQDLYLEKRNSKNPRLFEYLGNWEEADVVKDEIRVKGQNSHFHETEITRHGPIISKFTSLDAAHYALSLKWTAYQPSAELEAIVDMNKAQNWDEFAQALQSFQTPVQNFVFACKDGTIAYRTNGLIPIRKTRTSGLVPIPGWTDEYEWEGFIPWDELPTIINPEEGFISTANHKLVDDSYPYHISYTWAPSYRQQRIVDFLHSKSTLSLNDMKELQYDTYNLQAQGILPILLDIISQQNVDQLQSEVISILKAWDYEEDKSAAAPLVFNIWMDEIYKLLVQRIDKQVIKLFDNRTTKFDEIIRKVSQGEQSHWVNAQGGFAVVVHNSLQLTVERISKLQGNNPHTWTWGAFHSISFSHLLGRVKSLQYLFNSKPIPLSGSSNTVMAAGWNRQSGTVNHGAGWRFIVDTADLSKAEHIIGPGQSGHRFSKWYQDGKIPWTQGHYHVTLLNITAGTSRDKTLKLLPKQPI